MTSSAATTDSTELGVERAAALAPLLESIGREVQERTRVLEALLVERGRLPARWSPAHTLLEAECATHRYELRRARAELERLDCMLVSTRPCIFCLAVGSGRTSSVMFWRLRPGRKS